MGYAAYFKNNSGPASRYLTVRNEGGSAFTYHSERFNTPAFAATECFGHAGAPPTSAAVLVNLGPISVQS
jgi:hypothetical protein